VTPADRLLAAADLLDKRASEATEGPWRHTSRNYIGTGPIKITEADWGPEGHEGLRVSTQQDRNAFRTEDAAYIATVHPEVGKLWASALRAEAETITGWAPELAESHAALLLPIADALLAGAESAWL
jgi:hypothetical protein